MADELTVRANSYHEYWIDVRVNGVAFRAQVDTAMTQPSCEIGLSLESADFDRIISSLRHRQRVDRYVAGSPAPLATPTGIGRVSIVGLDGSEIETRIARLGTNLLGVCYFHRLPNFELRWDFTTRTMVFRQVQ